MDVAAVVDVGAPPEAVGSLDVDPTSGAVLAWSSVMWLAGTT